VGICALVPLMQFHTKTVYEVVNDLMLVLFNISIPVFTVLWFICFIYAELVFFSEVQFSPCIFNVLGLEYLTSLVISVVKVVPFFMGYT